MERGDSGGALKMVFYVFVCYPLTKDLQETLTGVYQPWYADYDASVELFTYINKLWDTLSAQGPTRGCLPDRFHMKLITFC